MTESTEIKLASFRQRFLAFIIDHLIFSFLAVILFFMIMTIKGITFESASFKELQFTMNFSIMLVFLVYVCKDSIGGQSIGRRIIRIAVRDKEDSIKIPNIARLILRNVTLIVWPVELIVLITSKNKSRLGDKISRTDVIYVK